MKSKLFFRSLGSYKIIGKSKNAVSYYQKKLQICSNTSHHKEDATYPTISIAYEIMKYYVLLIAEETPWCTKVIGRSFQYVYYMCDGGSL